MKLIALASFVTLSGSIALAAGLPKYSLPPGRHLEYSSEASEKQQGQDRTDAYRNDFSATVVAQNADGSAHVIVESAMHFGAGSEDRVTFGYADIFADGHYKPNPTLGPMMSIEPIFPRLPATDEELKFGWQAQQPASLRSETYRLISDGNGEFVFSSTEEGPIDQIYMVTNKATLHFDRAKGIVRGAEIETSQDYGFHSKGTGSLTLAKDETFDAAKTQQMGKDFDVYFAAHDRYMNLLQQIGDDPASAQKLLDQGKDALQQALAKVTSDPVHAELSRMLKEHDDYAKEELASAEHDLKFLNKPSPSWSASDMDGKEWKLEDLRGKVVVMDFWYRGCGWCMYATPQVKQLAADFKGKNVVVLGMNTDSDEKDARFVIKEFSLDYPVLKAGKIPTLYDIHGFPTLLVIDQQGVLRGIHVGYSPNLHDEVAKKINQLLNAKGASAE